MQILSSARKQVHKDQMQFFSAELNLIVVNLLIYGILVSSGKGILSGCTDIAKISVNMLKM